MESQHIDVLEVDNTAVRASQIERLQTVKRNRNEKAVQIALNALIAGAKDPNANLLELAIVAARKRASLGEISEALEKVFSRYQAHTHSVSGVYHREIAQNKSFKEACHLADEFFHKVGRRPRIMIAKLGQDGHDRGAKIIATSFADIGFDVDIGPLFQTPEEAAKQAAINDVHVLGISSLAAGHKTLVPQAIAALERMGRSDILVIAGGVIPPQDYDYLFEHGVAGVFGPGTVIADAALEILQIMITYFEK